MLDQSVTSYGVTETHQGADAFDAMAEELTRVGYTMLDSGLDSERIGLLRERLPRIYERQAAELRAAPLEQSDDSGVVRCPLAYDESFLELATSPRLLELSRRVFGENFVLLQQNGVINRPSRGHYQLRWHRDLPFQHWVASRPIAFAALLCLDPFNSETGGTYALPGSHRHEPFPSEEFVRKHQQVMTADAGTFIVMDAMMFHRAGRNVSDATRSGVNHVIGLPFLAQQISIPSMLGGAHEDDPLLARYLGYRWAPAPSVQAWRTQRLNG